MYAPVRVSPRFPAASRKCNTEETAENAVAPQANEKKIDHSVASGSLLFLFLPETGKRLPLLCSPHERRVVNQRNEQQLVLRNNFRTHFHFPFAQQTHHKLSWSIHKSPLLRSGVRHVHTQEDGTEGFCGVLDFFGTRCSCSGQIARLPDAATCRCIPMFASLVVLLGPRLLMMYCPR